MVYFNFLVDRRTPEYLSTRYEMEYWGPAYREGLEYLLRRDPQATIHLVAAENWGRTLRILPAAERRRIVITDRVHGAPDHHYVITNHNTVTNHTRGYQRRSFPLSPALYARRVYHNTILTVAALDPAQLDAATVADFREAYRAARSREPVAAESDFDLYLDGTTLTYVKDACPVDDLDARKLFLHVFPADAADLPAHQRESGFDNLDFYLWEGGARLDGACVAVVALPDYELTRIRSGQFVPGGGRQLWSVEFAVGPTAQRYREARAAIRSGAWGAPAARGAFDLYLDGTVLAYHKEPCAAEDLRARFFLHVIPAEAGDLSPQDRRHGFENRDFDYHEHGALFGAACVALAPLPEYAIARLRTGQFISGQGQLWSAEIAAAAQGP